MKQKPSVWALVWLRNTIKYDIKLLYGVFLHPQAPIKLKLAIIWIILYIVAPIDIIPDWIFGLWIIDDVTIVLLGIKRIKKNIPQKIKDEIDGKVIVMDKRD